MDNREKDKSNLEFGKSELPNDYKFLVQKLKSVSEIINLLEKNFLNKEI